MKSIQLIYVFICFTFVCNCSSDDTQTLEEEQQTEPIYFPPLDATAIWETKTIADLEWNESQVQPLLDYLETKNTKSFIVLHNGKIVIETYKNGHNNNGYTIRQETT